ncbi:chromosome segregation protein SMC [Paeniglutamicibacter sp. Y32M11]|uniref:chromosome segregation protein SMC n=1 Tax=Paeniglutamicibacter sp. Y32M11 TaxID=2853258 RepID=UPI001C52AA64|nr:chromosome segregation protein SMC [Paeniglutamicibacter sp. Y32M11]QXQ08928.1 chromosome segregation protein SMC [Paeniglutamicibacter sp. Y32M11]
MHLKTLTVRGFKSFASATTFEFEPGVTAVVGPNGSGKSNVVDALAWVMGEQGVKTLRGGKMEDVIFAGTSGRAALGRAHVSLTIDNADGALPIEYAEVTISRTLFRAGGSEYAINGTSCRLLDIQELLSDSGLGREMHVIVGQGQLDKILHATPEDRRGFIEEAAGVLKHRRRKEKTVRKLDAMQGNLNRLEDLTSEIRRQLTPLGKQAKIARRAQSVQFDVRDAKSRLLADDLVTLSDALSKDIAEETSQRENQKIVQAQLDETRAELATLEVAAAQATPELNRARDLWFALSSARERFRSLGALAAERSRLLGTDALEFDSSRDPDRLEAQAERLRDELEELEENLEMRRELLEAAVEEKGEAEEAAHAEQRRLTNQLRVAADRREGVARLAGQVGAARSKVDATAGELGRLRESLQGWAARREGTANEFAVLEQQAATVQDGEEDLDTAYEHAADQHEALVVRMDLQQKREQELATQLGALNGRLEALRMGAVRKDASEDILAGDYRGVLGRLSHHLGVEAGYEIAVAAALGPLAEALAVEELDHATAILGGLRDSDGGRVHLISGNVEPLAKDHPTTSIGKFALEVISAPEPLRGTLTHLLGSTIIVADLGEARELMSLDSTLRAVTLSGDVLTAATASGGTTAAPSLIEQNAAITETANELESVQQQLSALRLSAADLTAQLMTAEEAADAALSRLHDSDAKISAVAQRMEHLGSLLRQGYGERERLDQQVSLAEEKLEVEQEKLAELLERLDLVQDAPEDHEPETDERDELAAAAATARQKELDARLALRSAEERANGIRSRVESLKRAAETERRARVEAQRRAEARRAQALAASEVSAKVERIISFTNISIDRADAERELLQARREELEASLSLVRARVDQLGAELAALTSSVHRDELARAELRLRIETLENRSIEELGLTSEHLIENFGPHVLIPQPLAEEDKWAALHQTVDEQGNALPQGIAYDRVEQEKRLKTAERDLSALGRVNPLALEEFAALEERHVFLTSQLEDLKKSRKDLLDIIKDVDERVERVFTEAYRDTEAQFERVFERLFPGGEGRLVLTDPANMLTTGIEVEARPAGKKIKRLSLLSGGERSLTAVALLVAIFKARPSPFYVMDEVEAALDDTNLGRLITIFEELRESSQLIVITHQKRTMEVADALYGVTMRGDGVSTVISQRIERDQQLSA